MICDYYPNHEICKNRKSCELRIPTTPELQQLNQQLSWELKILENLKQRKKDYLKILSEIKQNKYCKDVIIKGELKRVPKLNAKGEYILKPEHVQVGLNYNDIIFDIKNSESIIRELRFKEHKILKILKKRADKYD